MNAYLIFRAIIILIFSILLSFEDIKFREISFLKIIPAIICGACCELIFNLSESWLYFVSAGIIALIYFLIRLVTKGKLGTGDILFGIFQGFFIHPKLIWLCLLSEAIIALIFFLLLFKKQDKKIPFIPFMSIGLIIVFCIELFRFSALVVETWS